MNPSQLACLLGIATVATGHGVMIEPHPYNLETAPLLQVSPLSAQLPFPCQGRTEHAERRTTLTAGTTQNVKFWIAAVHGGGSCQFSVTYEYPPPADPAKWKTIYTIIGDCPAKAAGNLPTVEKDKDGRENGPQCGNDSGSECVRSYDIPIPAGIQNAENATFAFTWFNKIGNREMYMNCAPVSIVGGTDDEEFMDSLPPVFQANIPGQCTTGESGQLLNIPNPGKFGKVNAEPSPSGNGLCPAGDPPTFVEGPPGSGTTGSLVVTPTSVLQSSSSSFMTVTTSARTVTSGQPKYGNSTMPSTGTVTSEAASAETSQPSWAHGMKACPSADGEIFCYDDNTFGLCTEGWADPMPLNKDQACKNGQILYNFSSSSSSVSAY
ncbi:hypothetical protein LA080_007551 [Diaporthe eres]|uniref:Extracellular protein n=1 Tax=Diaporthe vaccinii TaxID=105482 RepID=A0ABR4FF68_9PEZI|nr:hypothetical protein LA080_007551 [Diaporthe eres]